MHPNVQGNAKLLSFKQLTYFIKLREVTEQLDIHQALVKQFAKVLDFVLEFDECKMTNPALQNDFSYYRRVTQRMRTVLNSGGEVEPEGDDPKSKLLASCKEMEDVLPPRLGSAMSMFFASATPMLSAVSCTTTTFVRGSPNDENITTRVLSVMAKVFPLQSINLKFTDSRRFARLCWTLRN